MKTKVATLIDNKKPLYFTVCVTILLSLVFLYMYFLSMSVVHVVLRQEATQKAAMLESEIALLESAYIDSQHRVSSNLATLSEFTENSEKIFVSRTTPTLVFSDNLR